MNTIHKLLELTYIREVELEEKLASTFIKNYDFVDATKETNIQIQMACLTYLENNRRLLIHESKLQH